MKLSIIIPTYNSGKTIQDCLNSIKIQSFKDLEVVIVDGVSSDKTLEVIENNKASLPNLQLVSEADKGVYDAMNKGITLAKGEWVYFLGCDDVLHDDKVLEDTFNQPNVSSFDFVYGNVKFLYSGKVLGGELDLSRLFHEGNISHQAIFYKRTVFEKLGKFNLQYKVWADWDFNIRCFKHPELKINHFDRLIAVFNERDGLSGRTKMDEKLMEELPIFYERKYSKIIKKYLESKDYKIGHIVLKPLRFIKGKIFSKFQ